MSPGKLASQVAHASLGALLDEIRDSRTGTRFTLKPQSAAYTWLSEDFTKVVLQVNSEEELIEIYEKAKAKGYPCALIVDEGRTEFDGEPTITCIAIGPCFDTDINKLTGSLKLYR